MSTAAKRITFLLLVSVFLIYTLLVDTLGTSVDKGSAFLTEKGKAGKLLFQECNCIACHQLYGLGGYMGPDLTNVISAPGKGKMYVRAFVEHGTARMPDFHLSKEQMEELVEYLVYVDKTGTSPVKKFGINADGTITVGEE